MASRIINKSPIREFSGRIIGWIENCENGDQICRNFSGMILGTYDKQFDVTREFSGRIISNGNTVVGLLYK